MDRNVPIYSALAQIYDRVMAHVDYHLWAQYVHKAFSMSRRKVQKILDVSCGTGKLAAELYRYEYEIVGMDLSFAMLLQAQRRCRERGIYFLQGDARKLPFRENGFDAVLFMYDSLNYLYQAEDVLTFFYEVYHILAPNGIFIFDVVTPFGCQEHFPNYREENNWQDGKGYRRHAYYDAAAKIQHNEFEIYINGETYREHHRQRIYEIRQLIELIGMSPLDLLGVFDNFTFRPGSDESERVHFVCRKKK